MFKWVHISDLHIRNIGNHNENQLREKLPNYLRETIGRVDALLLTGDFRYAKDSKGDVTYASNVIKNLASALSLDLNKVFLVPGNHDLDRDEIRTAVLEANITQYDKKRGTFPEKFLSTFISGFSFFEEIETVLGHHATIKTRDNIHYVEHLEQVDLLLLNTSITAGRDDERGTLLLGTQYLEHALRKLRPDMPTIMIGHHGHSFLDADELKTVSLRLQEHNVKLYLCGHEHALWYETFGQGVQQYTAGCIYDDNGNVDIGFSVGQLDNQNNVSIDFHQWDSGYGRWSVRQKTDKEFSIGPDKKGNVLCAATEQREFILPEKYRMLSMKKYPFTLNGHTLLGNRGRDGIKYYWKKNGDCVESIAFNKRLCEPDPKHENEDQNISAYTISTSFGCILAASNQQCRFCETGSRHFRGFLSAEEIAMQAIFMASYDANCLSFPEVRNHKREFAFMGQGEPGLNYPAVREAIRLIDEAMAEINQTVHRYIISSCGITTFIPALIDDIKNGYFKNRVSLHFSLHGSGSTRATLMPIDTEYRYQDFIRCCKDFYKAEEEHFGQAAKIGVGLLMFKNFIPAVKAGETTPESTTLDIKQLEAILSELDPEIFRIDLSDFNQTSVTEQSVEMSNEEARALLTYAESLGFEAKIFSSFGQDRHSGCGMLKSEYLNVSPDGKTTRRKYENSLELLHYVINKDYIVHQ